MCRQASAQRHPLVHISRGRDPEEAVQVRRRGALVGAEQPRRLLVRRADVQLLEHGLGLVPRQVAVGTVGGHELFRRLPPAERPRHDGEAVALRPRRRDVVQDRRRKRFRDDRRGLNAPTPSDHRMHVSRRRRLQRGSRSWPFIGYLLCPLAVASTASRRVVSCDYRLGARPNAW